MWTNGLQRMETFLKTMYTGVPGLQSMPYTNKGVIMQTVTNVNSSFSVQKQPLTTAFALATNIQTFHNCWY